MHDHAGRLAVTTYPVLFGTRRLEWAPIDVRFELLTGAVDDGQVARVYVVPFVGDRCVVIGFKSGDWGPTGGGLEPGETWRAALERELAEEAGALLLSYTPFGILHCHSHGEPYRHHLPHPDFDCVYGYGDVEFVGAPLPRTGEDPTVAVEALPTERAIEFLAGVGRRWEADLYRLATDLRRTAANSRARFGGIG
jgi:8-oxo-dGTP diphosphatase